MLVRLWFWSRENPVPRIIGTGDGPTLRSGMSACFAPMHDPAWKHDDQGKQYFLRRGDIAGYMGEFCTDPGPTPKIVVKPVRSRERLQDTPKNRVRLSL